MWLWSSYSVPVLFLHTAACVYTLLVDLSLNAPLVIAVVDLLAGSAWLVTFPEGQDHALFEVDTAGMGGTSPFALVEEVSALLWTELVRLSGSSKHRAWTMSVFDIMGKVRRAKARVHDVTFFILCFLFGTVPSTEKHLWRMYLLKVVMGTQLEVQVVETMGTPTGTFFLGFGEG